MFTSEGAARPVPPSAPAADQPARTEIMPASPMAWLADPRWLVTTLWAGKGRILLWAIAGAVLAALASLLQAPRYVSTAQLLIDPRDLRVLQNEVSPNALGGDPTSTTGYLESQARVIASDTIKLRVIESEGLDKDPEFGGEAERSLFALPSFWPGSGVRDGRALALDALDSRVRVHRSERTFVIDISAQSRDPAKAARIANGLANAYLDDQATVRSEAAHRATAALSSRLEELRNRLRVAEEKTERFKEANNLVAAGGRTVSEEQLALNNAQLVASRTRVTEARARYEQTIGVQAAAVEAGSAPEAVSSATMTALRAQLGIALSREADLQASLGARHPSIAAAQAQTRDARRQIAEELRRIARAAKVDYDRALDAERQIARRVEELKTTQYATGRAAVQLRELEREVESSRAVYDVFLRRARETGELAGIDTTNARIISYATPPLQKVGIGRRAIVMAGTAAGGILGIGLVLAAALAAVGAMPPWWPRRRLAAEAASTGTDGPATDLKTEPPVPLPKPDAAKPAAEAGRPGWRKFVALPGGQSQARASEPVKPQAAPILATLPAVRHRRWRRADAEPRSVFQGREQLLDVLDKPNGAFAKAMRSLRASLTTQGRGRRILVLGLRPQAGVSTVALNLAMDAALAGEPALLLDVAAGSASLSALHAPGAGLGLAEVVDGSAGLVRAALQDEGTGLFFLPRTPRTATVGSAEIETRFVPAIKRFAPMIVDGGTLGEEGLTQSFAAVVDSIVIVLREGEATVADLDRVEATLGPAAAKLRGFVVNEA